MDITENNIKELGFKGAWYPGEGFSATIGTYGTNNYFSIILPHNRLDLPDGSIIFLKSFEQLKAIIDESDTDKT